MSESEEILEGGKGRARLDIARVLKERARHDRLTSIKTQVGKVQSSLETSFAGRLRVYTSLEQYKGILRPLPGKQIRCLLKILGYL